MGKLFEQIRSAVANDRFFVAWHADDRCEERGITAWQLVAGLEEAELVRERPRSKPNPSVNAFRRTALSQARGTL